jgi:hypothetical protein
MRVEGGGVCEVGYEILPAPFSLDQDFDALSQAEAGVCVCVCVCVPEK